MVCLHAETKARTAKKNKYKPRCPQSLRRPLPVKNSSGGTGSTPNHPQQDGTAISAHTEDIHIVHTSSGVSEPCVSGTLEPVRRCLNELKLFFTPPSTNRPPQSRPRPSAKRTRHTRQAPRERAAHCRSAIQCSRRERINQCRARTTGLVEETIPIGEPSSTLALHLNQNQKRTKRAQRKNAKVKRPPPPPTPHLPPPLPKKSRKANHKIQIAPPVANGGTGARS